MGLGVTTKVMEEEPDWLKPERAWLWVSLLPWHPTRGNVFHLLLYWLKRQPMFLERGIRSIKSRSFRPTRASLALAPIRRVKKFHQRPLLKFAMGQDVIQEVVQTKDRAYPLKRPPNHKVPVPRWTLKLPDGVTHIYTLYLGVQAHTQDTNSVLKAEKSIRDFLDNKKGQPIAVDVLRVTNGFDLIDSKVSVAYWTDSKEFNTKFEALDLKKLWNDLGNAKQSIGLWSESFATPIERLETNYASLLHQPGISQVPGSQFPAHNLTAYWGAGRDRLPAAKDDLFLPPDGIEPPDTAPKGIGEHLMGSNYDNMCHIRQCPLSSHTFDRS